MPREDLENAVAAARLVVIQEFEENQWISGGRQAQAACRVREDGQENADIPRRQFMM